MNWKTLLEGEMAEHGDSLAFVVGSTISTDKLDRDVVFFRDRPTGLAFTLWTLDRVYFPVSDGEDEWVGSVSRHPDNKPTRHGGRSVKS